MLVLAWFAIGSSTGLADERPRERTSSILFDNEPEILETRFGTVRNSRATRKAEPSPVTSEKIADEPSKSSAPPLPPRSDSAARDASRAHGSAANGWSATVWPLLFVVGLIVVGARWLKTRGPTATRGLPSEVFEVLGRKAIDPRTSVVMARCGSRLLVLSLSPHGLSTLAEITDPVEIDCLAGLCRSTQRDQTLVETFRSHESSTSERTR
ncbi:MAG: flagellar biosynthesis protein FliO [Planctomycetota bacterium]|nr:MAG: flagellar biosynthesis protein FliO [Planctomycetota bacterium]